MHLAMGLPFDEGEGIAEDLVHALKIFDQGAVLFGEEALLQFARVLGASAARVAESALSLFLSEIERPFVEATNADCLRLAVGQRRRCRRAALWCPTSSRHSCRSTSSGRSGASAPADSGPPAGERYCCNLTVGFVDLVDFTANPAGSTPTSWPRSSVASSRSPGKPW